MLKFQIANEFPDIPILSNDRPYTIEVYDCANKEKIEVLRINVGEGNTKGIEMGKIRSSNKVAPLDENTILKASTLVIVSFSFTLISQLWVQNAICSHVENIFESY